jgi:glutamine synthetase
MAELRFSALKELFSREPVEVSIPAEPVSTYFSDNVFDKRKMERFLSREAYKAVITAIDEGTPISRQIADQVATGMQAWAMEHEIGRAHV